MTMYQVVGSLVFAIGLLFLGFTGDATLAPAKELSNTIIGGYDDETMGYLAIGVAAIAGGGLLAAVGRRK